MSPRPKRRFRLGYIAAWLILLGAATLFTLERTGHLADALRERIAWRLGPLGEGLEIDDVRLSLLTPSLEVEGLRLTSPTTNELLIELERVVVRANFPPSRVDPIEVVLIDGGSVRINDELLSELRRILVSVGPTEAAEAEFVPPPAIVRRLEFLLELPPTDGRANVLDIGQVHLATRTLDESRLSVRGELRPFLNGATRRSQPIAFEGTQTADGFRVEARTRELEVSSQRFEIPPVLAQSPLEFFEGTLEIDASFVARLTDDGTDLNADCEARLHQAEIGFRGHSPLEAASVELAGGMRVAPGDTLWSREAWTAHTRVHGTWLGGPIDCTGSFGRAAPPDSLMLLTAHAPDFPLADPEVESLVNVENGVQIHEALEPVGLVDLTIATTFPMPSQANPKLEPPSALLRFHFDGRSGITFHGFRNPRPRPGQPEREGFPVPATLEDGQVVVHVEPKSPKPLRIVLRDIQAASKDSSIGLEAVIAPVQGHEFAILDLVADLEEIKIGDELARGLAGMQATETLFEDFHPKGGRASGRVTVSSGDDLGGVWANVDLDIDRVEACWRELPIPIPEASGKIQIRFAEDTVGRFRPFGAHVALATDPDESEGLALDVALRHDLPVTVEPRPRMGVDVSVDRLLLRGERWEDVRAQFPEVGEIVSELQAAGAVSVGYRGVQASVAEPFVHTTEITPGDPLRLTPTFFPRTARELAGRILVVTEVSDFQATEHPTHSNWLLSGTWPGGADLVARGTTDTEGVTRSDVVIAGIDPANEGFRGALTRATRDTEGGSVDLTENAVEGRLDARVESVMLPTEDGEEAEPENQVCLWLRGNTFRNDSITLSGLRGILDQTGDVFRSSSLAAELAGHPILLEDVAMFPLGHARDVVGADPILFRKNYWRDPNGLALQAKLTTANLPLDETHLEDILSKEALEWIRQDPDWSGQIDLPQAQMVLTNEQDGSGKVAIYGAARVHDVTLRPGLAIAVDSLDAEVRELIVEAGRIRMWGNVDNLNAQIEGRPLEDANMIVSYLDGRLTVGNLDGSFCGGRLRSVGAESGGASTAIAADLGEPYGFDLRLELEDVEADSFLRGVFQSSVADQGQVNGALFLRGKPSDILDIRGNGWISVQDAQLYSIPVIRALFGALGFDEQAVFDRMRTRFQWRDGRIHMTDIVVKSTLLKLVGDGFLDLDGRLKHDLEVRYSLVDRLGPLSVILNWINKALVRVRIRGDMDRPKIHINTLISTLLGQTSKGDRQLPLPPFSELEDRF